MKMFMFIFILLQPHKHLLTHSNPPAHSFLQASIFGPLLKVRLSHTGRVIHPDSNEYTFTNNNDVNLYSNKSNSNSNNSNKDKDKDRKDSSEGLPNAARKMAYKPTTSAKDKDRKSNQLLQVNY